MSDEDKKKFFEILEAAGLIDDEHKKRLHGKGVRSLESLKIAAAKPGQLTAIILGDNTSDDKAKKDAEKAEAIILESIRDRTEEEREDIEFQRICGMVSEEIRQKFAKNAIRSLPLLKLAADDTAEFVTLCTREDGTDEYDIVVKELEKLEELEAQKKISQSQPATQTQGVTMVAGGSGSVQVVGDIGMIGNTTNTTTRIFTDEYGQTVRETIKETKDRLGNVTKTSTKEIMHHSVPFVNTRTLEIGSGTFVGEHFGKIHNTSVSNQSFGREPEWKKTNIDEISEGKHEFRDKQLKIGKITGGNTTIYNHK